MKRFLTAVPDGTGYRITSSLDPSPALLARGLASPYYGAFGGPTPRPTATSEILFFFLLDPAATLAAIEGTWTRDDRSATFITHGHASVGLITEDPALVDKAKHLIDADDGYEHWTLVDGRVNQRQISRREPSSRVAIDPTFEVPEELSYEAATQLRQLSSNLAMIWSLAERHFPEFEQAAFAFGEHARTSIDQLILLDGDGSLSAVQERHQIVSSLVELNAGIAMLYAQAAGGCYLLRGPCSAVAEYSLLGVGHAWRGLFGLYRHLQAVFAESAHLDMLDEVFRARHTVRSLVGRNALNYDDWYNSSARLSKQTPPPGSAEARSHAVYFSGRQGFHETYGTMSAAWQAVHASASREWSLLTLSHEFVHAHVRDLVAWMLDGVDFDELVTYWESDDELPAKQAMQLAILSALRYVSIVRSQLDEINIATDVLEIDDWDLLPSPSELERLAQGRSRRYAHEIFVHVLDFLYIYGGNEDKYVRAVWGSWSHVPSVSRRIHHYVLRTLCALSGVRDKLQGQGQTFLDVEVKLKASLRNINEEPEGQNAVVEAALEYLNSEAGRRRLQVEYSQAFALVAFARYFLCDGRTITARLAHDPDEVVTVEGRYVDLTVGSFHGTASPTTLLLDQQASYPAAAKRESEYHSLWQLFQIGR